LTAIKAVAVAVVLLFASSIVRADGVDPRPSLGGGPGHSPTCGSNTGSTGSGLLALDCHVVSVSDGGTGPVTKFSFEVADIDTFSAGITCVSAAAPGQFPLIGWTITSTNVSGGIDTCLATAPTTVSDATKDLLKKMKEPYTGKNDGDCDSDDFVLGVPVGCDLLISSFTPQDLFVANKPVGFASNDDALPVLPEPGTVSLLLVGLAGLPFVRRKFARQA
jgi:hypothetical protein